MSPSERRQALIEHLNRVRHDTYDNLAEKFNVSKRTIQNDITELTCSYPIVTVSGRYGGGVQMESWFYLDRRTLSPEQANLLKSLSKTLKGNELNVMNSIISQFAPY